MIVTRPSFLACCISGVGQDVTVYPATNSSALVALQNFADMQLDEIKRNIAARRNRIFLLMEEVRRLRIQQRLKVRKRSAL